MTTKGSNNPFPSVLLNEVATDGSDTPTPAADYRRLFLGEDGALHLIDSADVVTDVGGAGGSVATDAIWDAAGDLAVGSGANTAARLAMGAEGSALTVMDGVVGWNGATSMPGSPTTGQRVWRSDLAMEFYFDGTRWLSTTLHHHIGNLGQNISATGAYAAPSDTGITPILMPVPALGGGSDIWLVSLTTTFLVAGGTALSGSHKWVVLWTKRVTGNTDTTIVTVNIDSGSSSVWRTDTQSIGALLNNGTTHFMHAAMITKTGTPGPLLVHVDMQYRIVAT